MRAGFLLVFREVGDSSVLGVWALQGGAHGTVFPSLRVDAPPPRMKGQNHGLGPLSELNRGQVLRVAGHSGRLPRKSELPQGERVSTELQEDRLGPGEGGRSDTPLMLQLHGCPGSPPSHLLLTSPVSFLFPPNVGARWHWLPWP